MFINNALSAAVQHMPGPWGLVPDLNYRYSVYTHHMTTNIPLTGGGGGDKTATSGAGMAQLTCELLLP